jgi:nitroimidazol reductase NimA-like FMN-containing flavoprotein (pyridoxamine 5'-phosphate oxidase superfamily)
VEEQHEVFGRLQQLLRDQRYAALATWNGRHPYANLVAFVAGADLHALTFATLRATRKFNNLTTDAAVALMVDNRSNQAADLRLAMAATAVGTAVEVRGTERAAYERSLLAKHPDLSTFVRSGGAALVRVDVSVYYVVTRFQNVLEFHVTERGINVSGRGG